MTSSSPGAEPPRTDRQRLVALATLGRPGSELRLTGWVDWSRSLAYLALTGPGAGQNAGAVPLLVYCAGYGCQPVVAAQRSARA